MPRRMREPKRLASSHRAERIANTPKTSSRSSLARRERPTGTSGRTPSSARTTSTSSTIAGIWSPRSIRPRSARCPTAAWCSGRPPSTVWLPARGRRRRIRIPTTPTGSTPTIGAVVPAMLTWARCSRTWRSSTLRFGTTTLRATSRCRSASTATTGRRATWRRTWNSAPLCTPSTSVRAIRCSSRRSTAGTATAATMPRTTARAWRCGTW